MSYFDPTRSDMMFRLIVSLAGLAMLAAALALRGVPADPTHMGTGLSAIVFLAVSAALSGLKLRDFRDV